MIQTNDIHVHTCNVDTLRALLECFSLFEGFWCGVVHVQCWIIVGSRGTQTQETFITLSNFPTLCVLLFTLHWSIVSYSCCFLCKCIIQCLIIVACMYQHMTSLCHEF